MNVQLDCLTVPSHCVTLKNDFMTDAEQAFYALAARVEDLCHAETDLVGAPFADVAFDHWLRDAEAARAAAVDAARTLRLSPVLSRSDAHLTILGASFETMMRTTDPQTYGHHHACFMSGASFWVRFEGIVGKSMEMFRARMAHLLSFDDYRPEELDLEEDATAGVELSI